MNTVASVFRLSVAARKGEKKENVDEVQVLEDFGIVGDGHAGSPRQVSLLPFESFEQVTSKGLQVEPGEFAENITTVGLDFSSVEIGQQLRIGDGVELRITQIGKKCHQGCYIREIVGDCIMPREGVFARVLKGGSIRPGDNIVWTGKSVSGRSAHHI